MGTDELSGREGKVLGKGGKDNLGRTIILFIALW